MYPPFCCKTHSITSFTDASCLRDFSPTPRCIASLQQARIDCAAVEADRGRPASSRLSINCCIDFTHQPVHTGSAELLNISPWNSCTRRRKRNPGSATLYYKLDEFRVNRYVQNKAALRCAKNHTKWFRRLKMWAVKRNGLSFRVIL